MIKKEKISKDNIVKFPSKLSDLEKEIEAVIFAAAEPLDVDTIENKVTKKGSVSKSLEKLQQEYSKRGINLVCKRKVVLQNFAQLVKHHVTRKDCRKKTF